MTDQGRIKGFSRMSREEKVQWLSRISNDQELSGFLDSFRLGDEELQNRFESFSENTLSNFHLPWGIVPNVLIDGQIYHVPVVIEESSVVAAASKAAAFWADRGGFKTLHISTIKKGQIHFFFPDDPSLLLQSWSKIVAEIFRQISHLTESMEKRGGGIIALNLKDAPEITPDYFQLDLQAETIDSMGANFINTVLEEIAACLPPLIKKFTGISGTDVLMSILSNYTPECVVNIQIEAAVKELTWDKNMSGEVFARRMKLASDVALHDVGRAVTHNKGIYNGVDAVVLATGNDFRAVEAAGHAFASRSGKYRSLSNISIFCNIFRMDIKIPLALGTVGGLTRLHPLAEKSLNILGNPDAKTLMKIAASVGLANNFAAMASLVTTGIQKGHMKMHLRNILNSLNVNPSLYPEVETYFQDKTISVKAVKQFLKSKD